MPTEEFALDDFSEHSLKHLLRPAIVVELSDEVYGLLTVHIRDKARIIQLCRPVENGLLRAHDKGGSIQHGGWSYPIDDSTGECSTRPLTTRSKNG